MAPARPIDTRASVSLDDSVPACAPPSLNRAVSWKPASFISLRLSVTVSV
jgi:hypothetical protein